MLNKYKRDLKAEKEVRAKREAKIKELTSVIEGLEEEKRAFNEKLEVNSFNLATISKQSQLREDEIENMKE